jgi:RNA polymerase sigma-70 factor (ECF subfamily)
MWMTIELSDAELARQIAAGNDPEAEAELFRRMAPRVRLYGLRHLRDSHAADDLTQQVLLTVIEALRASRLRAPEKLASFILGTCRMMVIEIRRGARRRQDLLDRYAAEWPTAIEPSVAAVDRNHLARCLGVLNERERAVIVMSFYDEKTCADLAAFLRVSEGNVRVIRHRALQQLRDCIGGHA